MEQEQQKENFDQSTSKNSLFTFFDIIKLKHIILFFLCLLFLGILIGGGNNERSPNRLAIKGKKCKVNKNDNLAQKKEHAVKSNESIASNGKNKVSKIDAITKNKTGNATENATTSINEGKETIDDFKAGKAEKDINCLEGKKKLEGEKKIVSNKIRLKQNFKPKNNNLSKGLVNNVDSNLANEEKNNEHTDKETTLKAAEEVKQNSQSNLNKSAGSNSIENEIELLKKEVKKLKNRISQLGNSSGKQNDVAALQNDADFINERIKFWQSVKENAQNNN